MAIKVSASLLAMNFCKIAEEIHMLEKAGIDSLHFDVMDGSFVESISMGHLILQAIRSITTLPIDVHLMVQDPMRHIKRMAEAGADRIIIHAENSSIHRLLLEIKNLGKKAGIAISPATSPIFLKYLLDLIDLIVVMTVNPGSGGQDFLHSQIEKVEEVANIIVNHNIQIAVDGGINPHTAPLVIAKGATILIAGKAIMATSDYAVSIDSIRRCIYSMQMKS